MAKSSYQNRLEDIQILREELKDLIEKTRKVIENISDDKQRVKAYFETGVEAFAPIAYGDGKLAYYQINEKFKGRPERRYVVLESGRVVSVRDWENGDRH